jgi:hypothetical protein
MRRGAGPHPRGHSDLPEMAHSGLATRGRSRGGGAPTNSAGDDHGSAGQREMTNSVVSAELGSAMVVATQGSE